MFMENHNEVIAFIGHRLALSGVTKVVGERRDKGRKVQTKLARGREIGNNGRERETGSNGRTRERQQWEDEGIFQKIGR